MSFVSWLCQAYSLNYLMRIELILQVVFYLPGDQTMFIPWKEHEWAVIVQVSPDLHRFSRFREDVHLVLVEAHASIDLTL